MRVEHPFHYQLPVRGDEPASVFMMGFRGKMFTAHDSLGWILGDLGGWLCCAEFRS